MTAMIKFCQGGLHRAIAAVDDQHLGLDARNHLQSFGDLADFLDFIMEYIRIFGAIGANGWQHRSVAS
jgi:hypothetical protein